MFDSGKDRKEGALRKDEDDFSQDIATRTYK